MLCCPLVAIAPATLSLQGQVFRRPGPAKHTGPAGVAQDTSSATTFCVLVYQRAGCCQDHVRGRPHRPSATHESTGGTSGYHDQEAQVPAATKTATKKSPARKTAAKKSTAKKT